MIKLEDDVFYRYINQLIEQEISSINTSFVMQQKLYSDLLSYLQAIHLDITPNACSKLKTGCEMIEKLLNHIHSFESLLNHLDALKNSISLTDNKLSDDIKEYNEIASTTIKKIRVETLEIQDFIQDELIECSIENALFLDKPIKQTDHSKSNYSQLNTESEPVPTTQLSNYRVKIPKGMSFKNCRLVENTLIVSELTNTVKLPYTFGELRDILKNSSHTFVSIREIIKDLYTKPLSNYKNSAFARFKEGFNLIRKKEKGSIPEALELGFELFSNDSLHPVIITACKNLNELDVYLSCLEYNELKDFPFFKVIFNVAPTISKRAVIKRTVAKNNNTRRRKAARHMLD